MPFRIDEKKMDAATNLDLGKPPVESFAHEEFPLMVYKHPRVATRIVREKVNGEFQDREVPTEHKTKLAHSKAELDQALKEGWQKKPYVAPALPSAEDEDLYDHEPRAKHRE